MSKKYLDDAGLQTLSSEIKNYVKDTVSNKVDKVNGKDLSTNDYTTAEKEKLASIEDEANKTIVDSALSSSSTNPVQNKVIDAALNEKVPISRTINGKALTENITLSASDVNAYAKEEIDSLELITTDDIDTICGTSIQIATVSEVTF